MPRADVCNILVCDLERQRFITTKEDFLPDIKAYSTYDEQVDIICSAVRDTTSVDCDLVFLGATCEFEYELCFVPVLLTFQAMYRDASSLSDKQNWMPFARANQVKVKYMPELVLPFLTRIAKFGLEYFEKNPVPYVRPGFFAEISEWVQGELTKSGHKATSIVQIRGELESYLGSAETESGSVFYFKALAPQCIHNEAAVTWALAQVMPETFWKPVSVDEDRRWLLMKNYGKAFDYEDCLLRENPDLVKQILTVWTGVQKKSIPLIDKFLEQGVPLYDLDEYKRRYAEALNDPEYLETQWDDMSEENQIRYGREGYKREALSFMERICNKLAEYEVPLTLVHGDLSPTNVSRRGDNDFSYFDNAYTCISFPFFDAITFINFCEGEREDLDFYLEQWTEYGSMENLRELMVVLGDFLYVEGQLIGYDTFRKTRECNRATSRNSMARAHCSMFSKYL